jgi:hypothetical protein
MLQKLSLTAFRIAACTHLTGTWLGSRIETMRIVVDENGDLPPDIIRAIHLMLSVADGTQYAQPGDALQFRNMLHFLDSYIAPPK